MKSAASKKSGRLKTADRSIFTSRLFANSKQRSRTQKKTSLRNGRLAAQTARQPLANRCGSNSAHRCGSEGLENEQLDVWLNSRHDSNGAGIKTTRTEERMADPPTQDQLTLSTGRPHESSASRRRFEFDGGYPVIRVSRLVALLPSFCFSRHHKHSTQLLGKSEAESINNTRRPKSGNGGYSIMRRGDVLSRTFISPAGFPAVRCARQHYQAKPELR